MPAKTKYATEEERIEARKEQKRHSEKKRRGKLADVEGRQIKGRRTFETEEERKIAKIETQRKADKKQHEKKQAKKPAWVPRFVGVDGESYVTGALLEDMKTKAQDYCLLLRNDKKEIFNRNGLSSFAALNYLTSKGEKGTAYVGYVLNFDFEWILKDLTADEYKALQRGEMVTPECFDGFFRLRWFIGKMLEVYRLRASAQRKKPEEIDEKRDYWKTTIQDVSGFFQSSFVQALQKWGFSEDARLQEIIAGKAARGEFSFEDRKAVESYNAMEMELLEELMLQVYESFKAAYLKAGLKFKPHAGSWTGPGVFANDFLKQTNFVEEHEPPPADQVAHFSEEYKEFFGNDIALYYPFSLSYFGGRIELAAAGRFKQPVINYDITSAYPFALSLLPKWTEDDFKVYIKGGSATDPETRAFLSRRLMGMYGVEFRFPAGWRWYPFPVRSLDEGSPNVFYPRQGSTHVMSPELFAVLDTLTDEEKKYVYITYAYVLEHTAGYGDALKRMPDEELCTTAKMTLKMADVRIECKAASKRLETPKEMPEDKILAKAEKALKLILNSLYGKTVQQVGSHKNYNDFVSAWITSVCRAWLWRGIAPEKENDTVIMTMTDGLYSLKPLKFPEDNLTKELGAWEKEDFDYFEGFKPGVYRYHDAEGWHYKVRGFLTPTDQDRERLFALIWEALTKGSVGQFPARQFITRNLALHDNWKRAPYLRQFKEEMKDIEAELKAKRTSNPGSGWLLPEGKENVFFLPKREFSINESKGYALDFDNPMKLPEKDDDEEIEAFLEKYESVIGYEDYTA